jgi:hypothetical protein
VESLARETDSPVELVQQIFTIERAKRERTARIKTYVPVLVHRHVRALLRALSVASHGLPRDVRFSVLLLPKPQSQPFGARTRSEAQKLRSQYYVGEIYLTNESVSFVSEDA